ncbi:raffinose/stachyose/melibiose transport system permease protein [Amycolatopsis pretoriensis]|uniref:Raffinose/stachyose/melibiose transport system permease protein n=1 Tax=Amycolatopsis pretoriensis TaxID=218821 RepID=A0A1H5R1I9_9PSEU|nr:carbohydrate ABC transporter permease [Amycolatopsis pretoriensis]SEF32205.1 raffinose/stachyose/melibiose transport system permease protein [Amycolatopsis pretoriensis]
MNRYRGRTLALELVMILAGLLFFFPVYVLVNLSLKSPGDSSSPLEPARDITFANYSDAWIQGGLGGALANSALITIGSVTLIVVISALAAYPLARVTQRWSKLAFAGFMLGLLVPMQLAMIPLYTTMRDLGLLGSLWALVIYYAGLQVPFSVFLYVGFLRTVPQEYEEAAAIDGCSTFATFRRVVFPLLRPVTGTVVILNVLNVWNDFLTPLLYLSGSDRQTVPVSLFGFVGQYVSQWNLVFAGLVISIAPILLAYFLMQRTIIKGFASGLKG